MVFNWFKRLFCVFLGFGVTTPRLRGCWSFSFQSSTRKADPGDGDGRQDCLWCFAGRAESIWGDLAPIDGGQVSGWSPEIQGDANRAVSIPLVHGTGAVE